MGASESEGRLVGEVELFTFKRGVLSRVAHDLRLSVGEFELTERDGVVEGRFVVDSIGVDGVMKRGRLDRRGLSAGDKEKIRGNIQREVLRSRAHPEVRLVGRREGAFRGELTMRGVTREVGCDLEQRANGIFGSLELTPSRWGIEPFKALMGAIQLEDRVVVRFALRHAE